MHVVYIHQYFSTKEGTTGTRSYEMSQRLLAAGHHVTMICAASENAPPSFRRDERVSRFEVDGIRVICIAEPYSNTMGFARRALAFTRFARDATRVVKSLTGVDLVFATSTPLTVAIPGVKGSRYLKVPLVFEVRDLWPELPIAMGLVRNPLMVWYMRRLERTAYFSSRRVIALAPGIRDGICRLGYPAERVAVIPNSCDLDLFTPSREPLDNSRFGAPGDFRLVFTGAHGLANGLDAVLDAVAELKRRGARGLRFVFIGSGGQRDRLMARSRSEGLDDLCVWLKAVPKEELARVLPRMDVGLMILRNVPAFYFGTSPNKFFDYISCGLPVLNNYPGWLANMIEVNRCGLAVPPDDAKAFADAVLWLRDHPEERREMGRRSRALAEREFSRDHMGRLFVETLEAARADFRG